MNSVLLQLYHRSPYPLRVMTASARGYYLRSWRYGYETDRLAHEAGERERWSTVQWQAWRETQLAFVLHRAATQVPYYREQWAARRRHGDKAAWDVLANWPILTKDALRAHPHAFIAEDCDPRRMFHEYTSGTSGKPLNLWWSRATVRSWYALFEARIRHWNDVSRRDTWAIMGGQLVVPFEQRKPPFWVWNAGLQQVYMSTYHLTPTTVAAYVDMLRRYEVVYLLGYASAMYTLAKLALDQQLELPPLRVAISNAELLYDYQRDTIARAFGCPVRNTYGMAEIVCAASDCPQGTLHLWPEVSVLEVMNDAEEIAPLGQTGRFICSGLLNTDMPLIRYEVGDRGALAAEGTCSCGRTLPSLTSIDGRTNDVILTADGRRIFWLNPVFYGLPVNEAQIIQESLDRLRVCFVPAPDFSERDGQTIVDRLRKRVGDLDVELEAVTAIPRSANGKFRAIISRVTDISATHA